LALDVENLYRRYGPFVLRRCRRLLGAEPEALEALQEVFLQILRRQDLLDEHALGGLLHRTATNLCLNRLRSRRRRPHDSASDMLDSLTSSSREHDRSEARSLLVRALDEAPESSAEIVMLHFYDGLTLEQTARQVGMSVSGVRDRLRRLRTTLLELRDDG
jgi:RNA polymerase sigma factor (sigma-70 family)